jgi:hypothetical protein
MEVTAVATAPGHPGVLRFAIDGPRDGQQIDADALEIDGWVVGAAAPVRAIEVVGDRGRLCRLALDRERPDVAAAVPGRPWALRSGFRGRAPLSGAERQRLTVVADTGDGGRAALATVELRQLPPDDDAPAWDGPDFLVIGAQRSGSTSLYAYLTQHPQVAPAAQKEVKFFSTFFDRGWGWYRRQFPDPLPAGAVTGEATPYYLFHPHAPRRVAARLPRTRLIAVLRDPVDRALSHWAHETAGGTEWLPFAEAIAAEPDRLAGERERMLADEGYVSSALQHHSYLARGRYAEQLEGWFARVPRERLLVLRSEDLYADPAAAVRRATDFLGLDPAPLRDPRPHNERAYPPLDPALRAELAEAFAAPNRALERLLGRPFGWGAR